MAAVRYEKGLANDPIIASFKVSERYTPHHGEISVIHQAPIKCITLIQHIKRYGGKDDVKGV